MKRLAGWAIALAFAALISSPASAHSSQPPREPQLSALKAKLDPIANRFRGRLGYSVRLLKTGEIIHHRGEERFPSASTIKTVVMYEALKQIEAGTLKWTDRLALEPLEKRSKSMYVYFLRDDVKPNIEGLINLMMVYSDNTATVMLSDKLGVENIERTLLGMGYNDTACTIRVPATNERLTRLRRSFLNMGVTSPVEMNNFLHMIATRKGSTLSAEAHERMIRTMSKQYWDDWVMATVPPDVVVSSKVGALNRSRSEAAIVWGPRPYILTVYTDNGADQRWTDDNEAQQAIIRIASLTWNHLHPERPYAVSPGILKYPPTGGGID